MSVAIGERFGPYQVVEQIGSGGMGVVYRATDARLKRDVALKVLPASFSCDPQRVARFEREAEVLASLSHTNIAHLYGLERSGATTALVMELVDGPTLAERIARGPLPPREALALALEIAAAIEAAHERGVVHRDLKPANVKLTRDGTVKVLDFGIAKALDPQTSMSGSQALTTPAMKDAGLALGTAAYMAPEQARGQSVDQRADIWAFGCVLYEMLMGEAAFQGADTTSTLARVLEREPDLAALPKSVAPNVRTAIELCLRKDPRQRIGSIHDVRLALEGTFESRTAVAQSDAETWWRRALPIVAILGTAAVASAYLLRTPGPAESAAPPAPPMAVARFTVTPPAGTELTNLGGHDVTISPDGARVAFWAEDIQRRDVALYVRDVDALEPRRISGTELLSPLPDLNPFFSPDGRSIGFHSPGVGIVRVPIEGASPLKIADDMPLFLGAAWGADNALVYSTGGQLFRIGAAGGTPQPLTPDPGPNPTRALAAPVLLPNGRGVLFGAIEPDAESVVVLDLESGEQKVLVEGGQNPMYAATGHLLYARGTTLWAAPFDLAELALTGDPVPMLPGVRDPNIVTASDYAVSASGTLVYVPNGQQDVRSSVVWVGRDGQALQRAVSDALVNPANPLLSPDGTRLLLTTGSSINSEVWVYDLRGRPAIPLATTDDNNQGVWSPDGARVAFSGFRGVNLNVFVARADGSELDPAPLLRERLAALPREWSSAGELLAVRPFEGSMVAVEVATGATREIVATAVGDIDPDLSPNGRWLAYASSRTGRPEIWVRSYPDGIPQRISANGGIEPRWSADGRELFFLQGDTMMAAAIGTDGDFSFETPRELFTGRYIVYATQWYSSYDVAADGRFVMLEPPDDGSATRSETSFVVVQNWIEELKRAVPARDVTGRLP